MEANSHQICGGYRDSGNGEIIGEINTGVAPTPDPLSHLPVPDASECSVQSTSKLNLSNDVATSLQPGVYQGGIDITNGHVTLEPGIYIIEGGGFQVAGNGSVTAEGVMIYNTASQSHSAAVFQITGNGTINKTAPTEGVYQGISLFQDRALDREVLITGNGNTKLTGTVYAARARESLWQRGIRCRCPRWSFVCHTMKVTGNGDFEIKSGDAKVLVRQFALVE